MTCPRTSTLNQTRPVRQSNGSTLTLIFSVTITASSTPAHHSAVG
ncbi:hypothetical protein [Pseudonocardia asaccharolytica]|nr:hypothetical protein [Pseudonocardia asaccharolytica]